MICQVDTCGESTGLSPAEATVWVAQGVSPAHVRLLAVCEAHADGWYDGCDEWLPHVREPVIDAETLTVIVRLVGKRRAEFIDAFNEWAREPDIDVLFARTTDTPTGYPEGDWRFVPWA